MKIVFSILFSIFLSINILAQIPNGYYDDAFGLSGDDLMEALHNIIKDHTSVTYGSLWDHFAITDKKPNGKVWDIYSDIPGSMPPYEYTFFTDQCGNYNSEGDCYNREHTFPKSWFGGNAYPMHSDLHHLYPTDGYVNSKRSNHPYGEVSSPSWVSMNGSRLGDNSAPGYSGTVFEPIDGYKGDLARMHFYMATRYLGEDGNWPGSPAVNGAQLKEWTLNMLYDWHLNDPVSDKEINRNNAIYYIQNNRNPFVDHPEFVALIWFFTNIGDEIGQEMKVSIFPNPAEDVINITTVYPYYNVHYTITDYTGRRLLKGRTENSKVTTVDISFLNHGYYLVTFFEDNGLINRTLKLIK